MISVDILIPCSNTDPGSRRNEGGRLDRDIAERIMRHIKLSLVVPDGMYCECNADSIATFCVKVT
jgi:hypothetical protein